MDATLELQTLKLLLNKDNFNRYSKHIPSRIFSGKMRDLYEVLSYLHKESDKECISLDELLVAYKLHGSPTTAKVQMVESLIDTIKDIDYPSINIINKARDKEIAAKIAEKSIRVMNSRLDEDTLRDLIDYVQGIDTEVEIEQGQTYCSSELSILQEKESGEVFRFGIDFIEEEVSSPERGQFLIVFARPETGKSSFVAQLGVGYLQQGLNVLYLANEEPDKKIMANHIRCAENKTVQEILDKGSAPEWEAIRDRFKLLSIYDYNVYDVENIIKTSKPDVVIIDQLDNLNATTSLPRHEQLEQTYQRMRQLSGKHNFLMIAVSQASADAEGKLKLTSDMMANSKTGKAGAADMIIGIGMRDVDDPTRSITLCKNKINGIHKSIYCKIDAQRCRYVP